MATCPLLPTQNYVALVVQDLPRSGLIITPEERSHFGIVEVVGPDCEYVERGDEVIFGRWTTEVTAEGKVYLLVAEENLLAHYWRANKEEEECAS